MFNHLLPEECVSLLICRLEEKDVHINSDLAHNTDIKPLSQKMKQPPDWRKAHDVEYLTKEIFGRCLDNIDFTSAEQQPLQVSASLVTSCMRDTFEQRSRRSNTTTNTNNNKSPSTDPMFEDLFSHLYSLNLANRTPPFTAPSTPNPAEEPEPGQKQEQEQTMHTHSYNTAIAYKEKQQNDPSSSSSDSEEDTDSDTPATPTSQTQPGPPCKPSKPPQSTKQLTAPPNSPS